MKVKNKASLICGIFMIILGLCEIYIFISIRPTFTSILASVICFIFGINSIRLGFKEKKRKKI